MGCHLRHFMPYVKDHCAFVPESTAPERGRRLFPRRETAGASAVPSNIFPREEKTQQGSSDEDKFIFVTGGVLSSLGKGLAAASLGALLKARGLSVTIQKLDPYINVDPGTMSPFQHGEVFVTDDGAETDLDLGHYERYLGVPLSQKNNTTSGASISM